MSVKSALISGIGIAGPTLAYWLMEQGITPTIVERAPRLRPGGYLIDFWGLGYDIAERMGLRAELHAVGYAMQELRLVDANGRRIAGFGAKVFRELTGGRYISLPRSDLSRLIYNTIVGGCETIFGSSIARIKQESGGVEVAFEHGGSRHFDCVIGADGLHSKVRELAFGPEEEFRAYLGYKVASFEVEGYRPRDELAYVSYADPGRQIARYALRDNRTVFLLIFASDEPNRIPPHDTAGHKAALHAAFRGMGWECPQVLAALDRCNEVYFDDVSQIRMQTWSKGRVVLLGDAAFCPSLLAGQGSALAMIGAYVLAGELGLQSDDPEAAFRRYEERLQTFMTGKQQSAAQFASSFAPRTKLGLFLRNQITKAFAMPGLARLTFGRSLLDRLELPRYAQLSRAARYAEHEWPRFHA
jgi:2-polyprenyl-6-methoxyphenol hydroxylase-like FAD-dependent oxidoreductase